MKAGASDAAAVDAVAERVFFSPEARDLDDNLHFVRERVLRSSLDRAALLDVYAKIFRNRPGQRIADDDLDPLVNELRLAGIVRVGKGILQVRNEIYRRVFDWRWVRENMPEPELRRQRDAFYRGVWRVAGVSAAAVIVFASLLLYALAQARMKDRVIGKNEELLAQQETWIRQLKDAQKAREDEQKAREGEQKARQDAQQALDEARRQVEAYTVTTQRKLNTVLAVLRPLLATKSMAREKVLQEAEKLFDSAAQQPTRLPAEIELGQVDLLCTISRLYSVFGDLKQAEQRSRDAAAIVKAWLEQQPSNLELKRRLIECYNAVGDAILGEDRDGNSLRQRAPGDLKRAIDAYRDGLKLAQDTAGHGAERHAWLQLVFAAHTNIGDVHARLDQRNDAAAEYRKAAAVIEELRREKPADGVLTNSLAATHDRLGDLALEKGDRETAKTEFRKALELRERRPHAADDPEYLDGIATSFNKFGKAAPPQSREALDWYRKSLAVRRKLAAADASNTAWQRNLAFSCNNVASVEKEIGSKAEAIRLYRERVKITQRLHEEVDPSNGEWRLNYGEALNRLADTLLHDSNAKDWNEAVEFSRRAADLSEWKELRYLTVLAQGQRMTKREQERKRTLEVAEKLRAEQSIPAGIVEEYRREAGLQASRRGKR